MPVERDQPEPPPLPAGHPTQKDRWRDSLCIPALFYFEVIAGQLLLVMMVYALQCLIPWVAPVAIFGQPFLWFYLVYRLARRVIESRNARGKPRWEATVVFAFALLLPALAALFVGLEVIRRAQEPHRPDEPKIALTEIARAERQFKKDFGRYTVNARELGYQPPENSQPHYVLGFATVCTVKAGVEQSKAQWQVDDPTFVREKKSEIDAYFRNARLAADCKDPSEGFEAFAVGVARKGAPLDVWVINERRELRNVQDGF